MYILTLPDVFQQIFLILFSAVRETASCHDYSHFANSFLLTHNFTSQCLGIENITIVQNYIINYTCILTLPDVFQQVFLRLFSAVLDVASCHDHSHFANSFLLIRSNHQRNRIGIFTSRGSENADK